MGKHALLSASSAYRWLACPPSARLEEQFPDSKSEYAEEGTLAHEIAALMLEKHFTTSIKPKEFARRLAALQEKPLYSPAMLEHVTAYYDYVIEQYRALTLPVILIEQRVDFSEYAPEGFGTCDCILIGGDTMQVIDLKYGAGVPVSAEGNAQMRLYALGALNEFSFVYDIERISMTIYQPRLDSISTAEMSAEELTSWGDTVVIPAAALAIEGKGDYCAGDHCRFCRAKAQCRARAEENLKATQYDFALPPLLNDGEVAEILGLAEKLIAWAKDIQDFALVEARDHDKAWPGWKLVEGRSNRAYADADQVASKLILSGIEEAIIYERSLLGLTAMEKALGGKKKLETLIGDLIIKPPGKPVLVPETDKRPALSTTAAAAADFKEEN